MPSATHVDRLELRVSYLLSWLNFVSCLVSLGCVDLPVTSVHCCMYTDWLFYTWLITSSFTYFFISCILCFKEKKFSLVVPSDKLSRLQKINYKNHVCLVCLSKCVWNRDLLSSQNVLSSASESFQLHLPWFDSGLCGISLRNEAADYLYSSKEGILASQHSCKLFYADSS